MVETTANHLKTCNNSEMDKIAWIVVYKASIIIACITGATVLSMGNHAGWGWLILIAIVVLL